MSEKLDRKLKLAMDETRLLLLGGQVLLGFHFQAVFQDGFASLSSLSARIILVGTGLMVLSLTLMIAPAMQHRLVEQGDASGRLLRLTSSCAGASLVPLSISLSLAMGTIFGGHFGSVVGTLIALIMAATCFLLWFGVEIVVGLSEGHNRMEKNTTPLPTKVEQLLTEARVIIPGCQALFGFQFVAMLTKSFDQLPTNAQVAHATALSFVALSVVLLMTPAALHRLSFGGDDSEVFLRLGSKFVVVAPLFLSLGISVELFVVFSKVTESPGASILAGVIAWITMTACWYLIPLAIRRSASASHAFGPNAELNSGKHKAKG